MSTNPEIKGLLGRIMEQCMTIAKSELDEYIISQSNRPQIHFVASRTKNDCVREFYDMYSMDCFTEPVSSHVMSPLGGMIYITIGNTRKLILAVDYQSEPSEITQSILDAETLCLSQNTTPYVLFITEDQDHLNRSYAPSTMNVMRHDIGNTDSMCGDEADDQMSNIIYHINIAKSIDDSPATVCVKSETMWTELEMLRICRWIVKQALYLSLS